jgi:hypothetical protein
VVPNPRCRKHYQFCVGPGDRHWADDGINDDAGYEIRLIEDDHVAGESAKRVTVPSAGQGYDLRLVAESYLRSRLVVFEDSRRNCLICEVEDSVEEYDALP